MEALFSLNDVELYDLERDPHELNNLALDRARHGELLLAMNDKLNRLIDAEVGEDVGQMTSSPFTSAIGISEWPVWVHN